jgi:hypothetical protein
MCELQLIATTEEDRDIRKNVFSCYAAKIRQDNCPGICKKSDWNSIAGGETELLS